MRKLVLILIAFIAVITFIRAFDNSTVNYSGINSSRIDSVGIHSEVILPVEE